MSPFWFTKKEFVDEKESHGLAKILFINFVCTVRIKEVIFFFKQKMAVISIENREIWT